MQVTFYSWRDSSSFRCYTLGPLCLWQCLLTSLSKFEHNLKCYIFAKLNAVLPSPFLWLMLPPHSIRICSVEFVPERLCVMEQCCAMLMMLKGRVQRVQEPQTRKNSVKGVPPIPSHGPQVEVLPNIIFPERVH